MTEYGLVFLFLFLIVFVVYREYLNRKDIEGLMNRLMSRDLVELRGSAGELREPESMSDRNEYEMQCKRSKTIPKNEEA